MLGLLIGEGLLLIHVYLLPIYICTDISAYTAAVKNDITDCHQARCGGITYVCETVTTHNVYDRTLPKKGRMLKGAQTPSTMVTASLQL